MARKRTNVRKLTKAIQEALEVSIQEATAQLDADLKNGSPVDSGRFRASWFHLNGTTQPGNAVAPEPETQSNVGLLGSIGRAFSRQLSFRAEPEKEQEATNPSMTSI